MVIFQPKERDIYIKGLLCIFLIREGEIDRDLRNKLEVNMNFDQKSAKYGSLRLTKGRNDL